MKYTNTKISFLAGVQGGIKSQIQPKVNTTILNLLACIDTEGNSDLYRYLASVVAEYEQTEDLITVGYIFAAHYNRGLIDIASVKADITEYLTCKNSYKASQSLTSSEIFAWWQNIIVNNNTAISLEGREFLLWLYKNAGAYFYVCFTNRELGTRLAIDKKLGQEISLTENNIYNFPSELLRLVIQYSCLEECGMSAVDLLALIKSGTVSTIGAVKDPANLIDKAMQTPSSSRSNTWLDDAGQAVDILGNISDKVRDWFSSDDDTTKTNVIYNPSSSDFTSSPSFMSFVGIGALGVLLLAFFRKKKK